VLLRWNHPVRGPIPPSVFIPLAERAALGGQVDAFVLASACATLRRWHDDSALDHLQMAVNVGSRKLDGALVALVTNAVKATGVHATRLTIEITERVMLDHISEVDLALAALKNLGVRIALDDFGTGYSSLMYLRRFPISNLKIDASFVRDITTDPGDAAIASGLIALAHSLDLRVTAEGVETMEQLEFLRRRRCDHVQGHVISPPLSADKCTELLRRGVDASLFANVPQPGA
jgi:EAL domain-containing protein (putative c-di-GMP-specific phosphodiesterase class I)